MTLHSPRNSAGGTYPSFLCRSLSSSCLAPSPPFSLSLALFLLAHHFLGFAEVWDYNLEWDRLPDLSQGYTRIAAIVPSHRSHCLGIDEWICICLAPELNFSLRSPAAPPLARRSSVACSANHPASRIWMPKTIPTYCKPNVRKWSASARSRAGPI